MHEPVHPQPPARGLERGHRVRDRVDPPAARRDHPRQAGCVRQGIGHAARRVGDRPAVEEGRDAGADDAEESGAADPARADSLARHLRQPAAFRLVCVFGHSRRTVDVAGGHGHYEMLNPGGGRLRRIRSRCRRARPRAGRAPARSRWRRGRASAAGRRRSRRRVRPPARPGGALRSASAPVMSMRPSPSRWSEQAVDLGVLGEQRDEGVLEARARCRTRARRAGAGGARSPSVQAGTSRRELAPEVDGDREPDPDQHRHLDVRGERKREREGVAGDEELRPRQAGEPERAGAAGEPGDGDDHGRGQHRLRQRPEQEAERQEGEDGQPGDEAARSSSSRRRAG